MTHDELLAEINRLDKVLTDSYGMSALRAVVELHNPEFWPSLNVTYCEGCKDQFYPCPTIEAVEKELT